MDETILNGGDDFYVWRSEKPGMTLVGSYIGRLLLTEARLLFLSSGTSGIGRAAVAAAIGGPLAAATFGRTKTDDLDLGALQNEGSLAIALPRVSSSKVKRRWDFSSYLTVTTDGSDGLPTAVAFMTKIGWNKSFLELFRSDLEEAREKLMRRARPLG